MPINTPDSNIIVRPTITVRSTWALMVWDCWCFGAQVADQGAHLFTGGAVHALDRSVADARVGAGGHVGIATLLVGNAKLLVFLTQVLDPLVQRRVTGSLVTNRARMPCTSRCRSWNWPQYFSRS